MLMLARESSTGTMFPRGVRNGLFPGRLGWQLCQPLCSVPIQYPLFGARQPNICDTRVVNQDVIKVIMALGIETGRNQVGRYCPVSFLF